MTYARIENGAIAEYPVYEGDIKLRFPNTSFPLPFTPPEGYEAVADVIQPEVDHTQVITEGTPAYIDGVLTRVWIVSDASAEVLTDRTSAKAASVRSERNRRLTESDWTQLPDAPVDATLWSTYRQDLRDITSQQGFPWDVVWPDEPQ